MSRHSTLTERCSRQRGDQTRLLTHFLDNALDRTCHSRPERRFGDLPRDLASVGDKGVNQKVQRLNWLMKVEWPSFEEELEIVDLAKRLARIARFEVHRPFGGASQAAMLMIEKFWAEVEPEHG